MEKKTRKISIGLLGVLLGAAALLGSQTSSAGEYQGQILNIFAVGQKVVVAISSGGGTGYCGGTGIAKFWLDPTVEYDRTMLALVLTAKTTSATVYMQGNDTCITDWPYSTSQRLLAINLN